MADDKYQGRFDRKHPWSRLRRKETWAPLTVEDGLDIAIDIQPLDTGYRRKGADRPLELEVSVKRAKRKERREDNQKHRLLDEEG